jgi:hypothetical protein
LEYTENKKKKIASKRVENVHQSFSSNAHRYNVKIMNNLLLLPSFHSSVSESFSSQDGKLN